MHSSPLTPLLKERVPFPRLHFVQSLQAACDNCRAQLAPGAAYCERCGARTRKARRLVRLAIRVELLFFALVVVLVIAFTWIYAVQK